MLLCLVLGAVTTVAVAWGLAALGLGNERSDQHSYLGYQNSQEFIGERHDGFGVRDYALFMRGGLTDYGRSLADELPQWADESTNSSEVRHVIAAGFPFLVMVARRSGIEVPPPGNVWNTGMGPQAVQWDDWEGGIVLAEGSPGFLFDDTILPIRPIWPAFLYNVLLCAVVWFIVLFGWRMHLRQIRKWQGYCPTCKYDLRGNRMPNTECQMPSRIGCPECGWGRVR